MPQHTSRYTEDEIKELLTNQLAGQAKVVKAVRFEVTENRGPNDQPTGGHSVATVVEWEDRPRPKPPEVPPTQGPNAVPHKEPGQGATPATPATPPGPPNPPKGKVPQVG